MTHHASTGKNKMLDLWSILYLQGLLAQEKRSAPPRDILIIVLLVEDSALILTKEIQQVSYYE